MHIFGSQVQFQDNRRQAKNIERASYFPMWFFGDSCGKKAELPRETLSVDVGIVL